MKPVTDPNLLKQLDSGMRPVTDEALISQLEGRNSNVIKDIALGGLRGAANIGATLVAPGDYLTDLEQGKDLGTSRAARKKSLDDFFSRNANKESIAYKGAELASEIAGTAGVGGVLAKVAKFAPKLATALETGGFKLGGEAATTVGGKVADAATRAGAGAAVGATAAGLVDPESAGTGAAIGAVLPGAVKAAGAAGKAIAPKKASEEVVSLFNRAKELGIDIPADRISNSRPLNAIASSLNYVPFSGRAATEEKMVSQFNRAISRTFGQDSDNVTGALKKANLELGTKFEQTLSNNGLKIDDAFIDDLGKNMRTAINELSESEAKIIGRQVDDIISKGAETGFLDGQAAYNIKKTLDRIGSRNTNEAFYARELKKSLMGALDRSLGPKQAAEFKQLRQQYGNMLDLESVAQRGAEGGVSIGRLSNMKDLNNKELSELADIAAQFLKTRENPHGAAQRVVMGTLAATMGGPVALAAGVGAGRVANSVLNSSTLKNAMLKDRAAQNKLLEIAGGPVARSIAYTSSTNP